MPTLASVRDAVLTRWTHPSRQSEGPTPAAPTQRQTGYYGLGDAFEGAIATGISYPGVAPGTSDEPVFPPKGFARGGGRVSTDFPWQFYGGYPFILPPDEINESWRLINLDASAIRGMPAPRLLRVLADLSPDVSRSLWDFLRLVNPGWEVTVTYPNSVRPHPQGTQAVKDWTEALTNLYGSMDVPIGRIHFGGFLRGALMAELVLDEQGRMPVDLATPDPQTVRFRRRTDPVRGQVWDLGQFQSARWVLLDRPTIMYVPIDPAPGIPYGRSPSAPSLFNSLFLLGMLADLRRVVAQQGYPRYDLLIKLDQLATMAGPATKNDPNSWKQFVEATTDAVAQAYNMLEPDGAFVHTDMVEVNPPTGAVSADSLRGVSQLIQILELQLARALKSMPLMMGMVEGSSEANANRQWEIQAAGIKSVQHLSESLLSHLGTVMLNAQGINAECHWKFAELRAAELYRDAMTKALMVDNATKTYLMGWDSQEQASQEATGHDPDQAEPRLVPSNETLPAFGNATAEGNVPERRGGRDNRPDDGTGGPNGSEESTEEPQKESAQGGNRSVRDFLRLRWDRAAPPPEKAKPVRPLGDALVVVPTSVRYELADQRECVQLWDNSMPSYSGMLNARLRDSEVERRWEAA